MMRRPICSHPPRDWRLKTDDCELPAEPRKPGRFVEKRLGTSRKGTASAVPPASYPMVSIVPGGRRSGGAERVCENTWIPAPRFREDGFRGNDKPGRELQAPRVSPPRKRGST